MTDRSSKELTDVMVKEAGAICNSRLAKDRCPQHLRSHQGPVPSRRLFSEQNLVPTSRHGHQESSEKGCEAAKKCDKQFPLHEQTARRSGIDKCRRHDGRHKSEQTDPMLVKPRQEGS